MWTTIKSNYKTILAAIVILFVAIALAFLFEDCYRQLIRFLFQIFNGNKVQFWGKNFHLFASYIFVAAFGLFTSFAFLLLKFSAKPYRIKRSCLAVATFLATTILITAFHSKQLIIECTACADGIIKLTFNQPTYDTYFVISLATAFSYLLTAYLVERKR